MPIPIQGRLDSPSFERSSAPHCCQSAGGDLSRSRPTCEYGYRVPRSRSLGGRGLGGVSRPLSISHGPATGRDSVGTGDDRWPTGNRRSRPTRHGKRMGKARFGGLSAGETGRPHLAQAHPPAETRDPLTSRVGSSGRYGFAPFRRLDSTATAVSGRSIVDGVVSTASNACTPPSTAGRPALGTDCHAGFDRRPGPTRRVSRDGRETGYRLRPGGRSYSRLPGSLPFAGAVGCRDDRLRRGFGCCYGVDG